MVRRLFYLFAMTGNAVGHILKMGKAVEQQMQLLYLRI